MLAFGFKVAWFTLSLLGTSFSSPFSDLADHPPPIPAGFLSNILALPAFAEALNGYTIPALYTGSNFVLQGIFCLGQFFRNLRRGV